MSRPIVSLDLETNGLDVRFHDAWEVAIVHEDGSYFESQFPVRDVSRSESAALEISNFYERYSGSQSTPPMLSAENLAKETTGVTLMGCAIQFDMRFLEALLHRYDLRPAWHHRALDLGSYAAGVLGDSKPLSTAEMAERLEVPNSHAHTALGDAKWNWEVYRKLQEVKQ